MDGGEPGPQALLEAGGAERAGQARGLVDEGLAAVEDPKLRSRLHVLQARLAAGGEEALAKLRQALLDDPDNLDAIRRMAAVYLDSRRLREASLYLKRAVQLDPENGALRVQLEQVEKALAGLP